MAAFIHSLGGPRSCDHSDWLRDSSHSLLSELESILIRSNSVGATVPWFLSFHGSFEEADSLVSRLVVPVDSGGSLFRNREG